MEKFSKCGNLRWAWRHLSVWRSYVLTKVNKHVLGSYGSVRIQPFTSGTFSLPPFRYCINACSIKTTPILEQIAVAAATYFDPSGLDTTLGGVAEYGPLIPDITRPDGDFNASNLVDLADLNLVLFNWQALGADLPPDWTHQRPGNTVTVGLDQLNLVLFNWQAADGGMVSVPEPATWMLFTLGLVAGLRLLRRRPAG